MKKNLQPIYEGLRAKTPDDCLEALFDLKKMLPELAEGQKPEVASAIASLFYLDTHDTPEFAPVVDQAVNLVASMGKELIPRHLEEMKGADLNAQDRFSVVLAKLGAEAVDPIIDACEESEDPRLLVGVIYALPKIKDISTIKGLPMLFKHARHEDAEVRDTIARAIGKLVQNFPATVFTDNQRVKIFETLLQATHDSVPAIRAKAVRGLGKMAAQGLLRDEDHPTVVERVQGILGHQDEYQWDTAFVVRREGEEALEHLGVKVSENGRAEW